MSLGRLAGGHPNKYRTEILPLKGPGRRQPNVSDWACSSDVDGLHRHDSNVILAPDRNLHTVPGRNGLLLRRLLHRPHRDTLNLMFRSNAGQT
jgi:hypothetical protein